jgi:hypothetical protein
LRELSATRSHTTPPLPCRVVRFRACVAPAYA